jgi:beta-N-acetylhexosaminidase
MIVRVAVRRWWPVVVIALIAAACGGATPAPVVEATATPLPVPTAMPTPTTAPTPDYDVLRVESLLADMSLRDKVGQLFLLGYFDTSATLDIYDMMRVGRPGGVVLFAHNVGNPAQTATVVNSLQAIAGETTGIPLLMAVDQEGGIVTRLRSGFTMWPNMMALGATRSEDLARQVGQGMAAEMRAVGINMDLAPVADVLSNPSNGVINVRSFGSDPTLVARYAGALMAGLHEGGVIATAKHFPGHGGTLADSHVQLPTDTRPREVLAADYAAFGGLIDQGVDVVMTAHVVYPALSGDGAAATFSHEILQGVLRDELGFEGVVLTDALSMGAVLQQYTVDEAVARAIRAGADMVTFGHGVTPEQQLAALDYLVAQVESGALDEARIDESVRRILALKARYGVLDTVPIDTAAIDFDLAGHQALSYEVAALAVTQLRDREQLLPLDADQPVTLVYPMDAPAAPTYFQLYDPDVNTIGVSRVVTAADQAGVLAAAGQGGKIVVLTLNAVTTPSQAALVRELPANRTIAVAVRSPYDLAAYPEVGTYLATYGAGDYAMDTLARMLYGGAGAPGRLPVILP